MVLKQIKCPECGYVGLVDCTEQMRTVGETCECPKCGFRMGQRRRN